MQQPLGSECSVGHLLVCVTSLDIPGLILPSLLNKPFSQCSIHQSQQQRGAVEAFTLSDIFSLNLFFSEFSPVVSRSCTSTMLIHQKASFFLDGSSSTQSFQHIMSMQHPSIEGLDQATSSE
jgi:hypothetical protein